MLTGHAPLNQHLSIIGLHSNPLHSQCNEAYVVCFYFSAIHTDVWGKFTLDPEDITNSMRFPNESLYTPYCRRESREIH